MESTHNTVGHEGVAMVYLLSGERDDEVVRLEGCLVLRCLPVAKTNDEGLTSLKLILLVELYLCAELGSASFFGGFHFILTDFLDGVGMHIIVVLSDVSYIVGHSHHIDKVHGKVADGDSLLLLRHYLYEGPCRCGGAGIMTYHVTLKALGPQAPTLGIGFGLRNEGELCIASVGYVIGHRGLADRQVDIVACVVAEIVAIVEVADSIILGTFYRHKLPHSLRIAVGIERHAGRIEEAPLSNGATGILGVEVNSVSTTHSILCSGIAHTVCVEVGDEVPLAYLEGLEACQERCLGIAH